jgi:hypothetical protein
LAKPGVTAIVTNPVGRLLDAGYLFSAGHGNSEDVRFIPRTGKNKLVFFRRRRPSAR